jgi:hypothetical protein
MLIATDEAGETLSLPGEHRAVSTWQSAESSLYTVHMRQRLLINWVYYQPVGHAIEAYRLAQAFRNANPDFEIAVAVNAQSGPELGTCVRAIDWVYPVTIEQATSPSGAATALASIPREWDYLYSDPRQCAPMGLVALDFIAEAVRTTFRARMVNNGWTVPDGYPRLQHSALAFELPSAAREFAARFLGRHTTTRISLLLGSSSYACRTPSVTFWRQLIRALSAEFAGAEIVLLGALKPGRSTTFGVDQHTIAQLVHEFPQVHNAFDVGLLNQLAIAQRCQLHISPHTGMSFAVQCVGVPWLVLSGGEMHEASLNGVPFVSIYPACDRYPCGPWFHPVKNVMLPECRERQAQNQPFLCMSDDRLTSMLPAILHAAHLLVERKLSYLDCVRTHYAAMLPRVGAEDGAAILFDWPGVMSEAFVFPESAATA